MLFGGFDRLIVPADFVIDFDDAGTGGVLPGWRANTLLELELIAETI